MRGSIGSAALLRRCGGKAPFRREVTAWPALLSSCRATPLSLRFRNFGANSTGEEEAKKDQSQDSLSVAKPASVAVPDADGKEVDNSIEAILARSQRKELIERVGPQAVRYLPNEDPNVFLIPDNRLEPAERTWQKIFVALPWAIFACMLAAPILLVRGNLPFLQRRAEEDRQAAARRTAGYVAERIPEFQVVNFGQMPDVLERPFPTVLMLFHPATYASKVFLPVLRDLQSLLQKAGIPVSVAALDLSASPGPAESFSWEYPSAMSPHIQLIVPRYTDGEAGVVDYDGHWTASGLAAAATSLAGPRSPEIAAEELQLLDVRVEKLRDLLFELFFLEDGAESKAVKKAPWWHLWRSSAQDETAIAKERSAALAKLEERIDLLNGIDAAISSCEQALAEFRGR